MKKLFLYELRVKYNGSKYIKNGQNEGPEKHKIYDKVEWHFKKTNKLKPSCKYLYNVLKWLNKNGLLNDKGKEKLKQHMDRSFTVDDSMLTYDGKELMDKCYKEFIRSNRNYNKGPNFEKLYRCCFGDNDKC